MENQKFEIEIDGILKEATVLKVVNIDDRKYVVYTVDSSIENADVYASEVIKDQEGNVLDVEIVPEKVDATIKLSSPSKTVPIKIETKGSLDNKAIKSLTSNVSSVTIYGSDQALEDIEYVTAQIDISGIKGNKKYNVNLKKPKKPKELLKKPNMKVITY